MPYETRLCARLATQRRKESANISFVGAPNFASASALAIDLRKSAVCFIISAARRAPICPVKHAPRFVGHLRSDHPADVRRIIRRCSLCRLFWTRTILGMCVALGAPVARLHRYSSCHAKPDPAQPAAESKSTARGDDLITIANCVSLAADACAISLRWRPVKSQTDTSHLT